LGLLLVIALVASLGAYHQFSSLVGNNTKDELSRYLDDNQHSTATPSGAGFKIDFPVPAERESETVSTGFGSVTAPRDAALVDDEIVFQVVWFQLPGATPANAAHLLDSFVTLQIRGFQGTRIAVDPQGKLDGAITRDFVFRNVDSVGTTRYYDERVMVEGHQVWIIRVVSRVRRDEAFRQFAASFTFTH
jgi:hypothetical protein